MPSLRRRLEQLEKRAGAVSVEWERQHRQYFMERLSRDPRPPFAQLYGEDNQAAAELHRVLLDRLAEHARTGFSAEPPPPSFMINAPPRDRQAAWMLERDPELVGWLCELATLRASRDGLRELLT